MVSTVSGLVLFSLASITLAKTDLGGCTSTQGAAGIVYYVPDTGEVCSILDCGGGRAPPKTNVPGCAAYEGNQPYVPSFMPGFTFSGTLTAPSESVPTQILTDSSAPPPSPSAAASSTLATVPSVTSPALSDTTTTIATGAAASSLLTTSGLLFDTSALTSDVTNTATAVFSSVSAGPATATGNSAARVMSGGQMVGAIVGIAAGIAMI